MISHPWVGGYVLKIGYHLSKVGLVLGKNRRWVGRQKMAQKIGYHLWMAPNYLLQIILNSLDIHAQDHKMLTGPALMVVLHQSKFRTFQMLFTLIW